MSQKKFDWSEFTLSVAIAAPVKKVYQMWTEPELLRKWFLSDAKMSIKKGGNYEWTWLAGTKEKGKLLDFKKPAKLSFTFANSVCDLTIKRDRRGSLVTLRQHDIPKTEKSKSGVFLNCNSGWTFYLINLKTYLEFGIDLRETGSPQLINGNILN
jgi:uncharacterized protein YndB with AHSA1/START domain